MTASATTVRRGLFGVLAGGVLVFGSAAVLAPAATAQPDPASDCTASSVADTVSAAAASESSYLVANPQANEALSGISAQPQGQQDAYNAYFEQNPQVKDDLLDVHQPVSALREQCGVDVTPTPVAQAVWSMQAATPAGVGAPAQDATQAETPAGVGAPVQEETQVDTPTGAEAPS